MFHFILIISSTKHHRRNNSFILHNFVLNLINLNSQTSIKDNVNSQFYEKDVIYDSYVLACSVKTLHSRYVHYCKLNDGRRVAQGRGTCRARACEVRCRQGVRCAPQRIFKCAPGRGSHECTLPYDHIIFNIQR